MMMHKGWPDGPHDPISTRQAIGQAALAELADPPLKPSLLLAVALSPLAVLALGTVALVRLY